MVGTHLKTVHKVVIFGGAFSPPTVAHEAIIAELLALSQFDEVWVMPSGDRADKDMTARDSDRLAMLRLVRKHSFYDDARLKNIDFELRMPRPSQTFQTVELLQKTYPDTEFWFAYGPDAYVSMPGWPNGETLQQKLKVVLFSSGGPDVPAKGKLIRLRISDAFCDASSTGARRLAADGAKDFTGLVSRPVAQYIQAKSLYVKR